MSPRTVTWFEFDVDASPTTTDGTADDDALDHFFCCDPDAALCGADLSDVAERDFDEDSPQMCVVCFDLDRSPVNVCRICGA